MGKTIKKFFKGILNKEFLISISCLMVVQVVLYFVLKFLQSDFHLVVSPIDQKIPFIPYFIYIYNMFYPFVFLVLYFVFYNDKKNYYQGIIAGIIGYLLSDIIFLVYPTTIIRPVNFYDKLDLLTAKFIKLTYEIDNPPINCLPSIHCLFCFQVAYTTITSKKIRRINKIIITIIALLIIISTVLVKQHYFYDILAALGIFCLANLMVYIVNVIIKRN